MNETLREFPRLTPKARELLRIMPRAGTGLHPWIFRTVRALKNCASDDMIRKIMALATKYASRDTTREIEEAIRGCKPSDEPYTPHVDMPHIPKWPEPNLKLIEALPEVHLVELEVKSPEEWTNPVDGMRTLFVTSPSDDPNPLICCGTKPAFAKTQSLSEWGAQMLSQALIVPSPMTSRIGINLAGKPSPRCLANTGPRRFLVCEFDKGPFEQQASAILRLSEALPLTLVVHSAGKSLHGWWKVAGLPEEQIIDFFKTAVLLGADPATWNRCQFVRLPGGLRDRRTLQRVLYYDPNAAK